MHLGISRPLQVLRILLQWADHLPDWGLRFCGFDSAPLMGGIFGPTFFRPVFVMEDLTGDIWHFGGFILELRSSR